MVPLDLTLTPPRAPRTDVRGVVFLARSIDKLRANLPGGKPGAYNLAGLTDTMLEMFGTTSERVLPIVAAAKDDDEVAATLVGGAPPGAVEKWNEFVSAREPRGGNREEAIKVYPWLAERDGLGLVLDVLAEDDRRSFA